jgi:PD-(D/E)XK nuclease superfamily
MREIDEITGMIVDAAFRVHSGLGPGLLESVYEVVLARELERQGLRVETQWPVTFEFDDKIRRTDETSPRQAAFDLSPTDESERWVAHQLRRADSQRRPKTHCQQLLAARLLVGGTTPQG